MRRAAMARTEYILCVLWWCGGGAVDPGISRVVSIDNADGIGDVVEGWLGCSDNSRRKGLHKLSKLKKPVP